MALRRRGLLNATSVNKFLKQFPTLIYTGTIIHCTVCQIDILPHGVFVCKRHVNSKKHILNVKRDIPYYKFLYDFIFMLSVCNIPQNVVDNEEFRRFWRKYIPEWKLPTRRTLQVRLPTIKSTIMEHIAAELKNKKIWLTVDETTDARRNCILNILVRTLKSDEASVPLLLSSTILQNTNAEIIAETVKNTCGKFNISVTQLSMIVTDGGSNMVKAAKLLKQSYPQLLHVTCLLHACHLVAEFIRKCYPKVDQLIASTKKIFIKSPKRIREFKQACPGIPQPPQPILTRWGTWLKAVLYYERYLHIIKHCILSLNPQEAQAIAVTQQLVSDTEVHTQVEQISENYSFLLETISKLENTHLTLHEALNIVHDLKVSLGHLTDNVGKSTTDKLSALIHKNPDFQSIVRIDKSLSETQGCDRNVNFFKFANITSLDAERSFSKYTNTFSPRRRRLSASTMETFLMIQYYSNFLRHSTSTTHSN